MVVDSACSSSLTALSLAVTGLRNGDYPMALVGAPSVISNGFYANTAYRGGALSPSGGSVPFSARRDGYLRGEGGACVLLKPLPAAIEDGDPVHGVILAVGTAHNGRGGGLTGTDAGSQARLLRRTADQAGRRVHDLGYLEAHATGTPAGDAAEVEALAEALDGLERPAGPGGKVWVGSVKANIGHLEGAAGLIALVKTLLVLKHGRIPCMAGLDVADPALPIGAAPVAIAAQEVPWPSGGKPRLAAINSFGLGGSLSQVLIEEAPAPGGRTRPPSGDDTLHVVPLSAETEAALRVLAGRLLRELDGAEPPSLASVARTMQTGRRAQRVRRALVVPDLGELRSALARVVAGGPDRRAGDTDPGPALGRVVSAWSAGDAVDWTVLWEGRERPVRASLPSSAFVRRSHWFDRQPPGGLSERP
jgi:acyl transferase domain-containing protein